MNAVTQTETRAIETAVPLEVADPTKNLILVPLSQLLPRRSKRNARKTPHSEAHIEALSASIAAKGMLQNLVVEPETNAEGKPTGFYLVSVGEGRIGTCSGHRGDCTKGGAVSKGETSWSPSCS